MSTLEDLRRKRMMINEREGKTLGNMDMIINESNRVAEVARDAERILDDLDREFESKTKLDKNDVKFLFFATALQCVRQYLISNEKFRFKDDQSSSKFFKQYAPISLAGPVPYDAFKKYSFEENTGISGANHRYTTLGHDPLLGWIFGTANILSETVTKNNFIFESYDTVLVGNEYKISGPTNIGIVFTKSIDRIQGNYKDLILAVAKHAVHLSSDAFTKMGLPIPIINSISPDLSSKLLKNGIDIYSVARSAAIASFINMLVATIHGLFYDEKKYPNRDMYEVKTRKILSYSNFLASSSNVIYTAITRDLTKLDVGGMIVTVYRLITDYKFIREVKEEFVFGTFHKLIEGEEFKFNEV